MFKTILFLSVLFLLFSCASKKDVLLFQNKSTLATAIQYAAPQIQVNDILSITVSTLQPELAAPFNLIPQNSNGGVQQVETLRLQGYLVNANGEITFPVLGVLQATAKTPQELEKEIKTRLQDNKLLLDPTVTVRILNSKVTILGEVARPGTYTYTEQNISVPQALGLAGDLTIRGQRKNILLIRENNGQRSYTTLDLTQTDWFTSDYYQVKQNDIIVVNPNLARVKNAGFVGEPSTLLSMASIVLSMIILLTR